jgi:hypothetical protein
LEPLFNLYNNERAAADEEMKWVNIWEDKLGNPDRIANTCMYYKRTRDHVYKAQTAARDIYLISPTSANKSRLETEQRNMTFLNTNVTNSCK